jgi:tRNA (mo5U34)-methyltransferase
MSELRIVDPEVIRTLIAGHEPWYHQVELAPGIVTPGGHGSALELASLDQLGLPQDAGGMRILDIGCRDGFFAFAMEKRRGEVVGIDYADPEITGFSICSKVLGSTVEYRTENVYDLSPERHGRFDLVLFLGVLYHLRNPLQALDAIRGICAEGAMLFVESQLSTDRWVRRKKLPLWQFYSRSTLSGDASNKWAPNIAGLQQVVEESQFEVSKTLVEKERGYVVGKAVADHSLDYHRRLDHSAGMYGRRE